MDKMISTKDAAVKWGYDKAVIWEWCRSGRIAGAVHGGPGCPWLIPEDAKCPRPVRTQEDTR